MLKDIDCVIYIGVTYKTLTCSYQQEFVDVISFVICNKSQQNWWTQLSVGDVQFSLESSACFLVTVFVDVVVGGGGVGFWLFGQ